MTITGWASIKLIVIPTCVTCTGGISDRPLNKTYIASYHTTVGHYNADQADKDFELDWAIAAGDTSVNIAQQISRLSPVLSKLNPPSIWSSRGIVNSPLGPQTARSEQLIDFKAFPASPRSPGRPSHALSGPPTLQYLMEVPEAIARCQLGHPHSPPQCWIAKRCGFGTTPFELARLGTCH